MKLTTYEKNRLEAYVLSISADDVPTSAIDYLLRKGLIYSKLEIPNGDDYDRCIVGGYALTDDGIRAVKKYIPNYWRPTENCI